MNQRGLVSELGCRGKSLKVLRVHFSSDEWANLKQASELVSLPVHEFVRRQAGAAAEIEVLEGSIITIPAQHWDAFQAWLESPPRDIPALTELVSRTPSWRK
jgi:uncharacterized protein (DUF1778 family)